MRHLVFALAFLGLILPATASDTTITYQGQLQDSAGPFSGQADMQFQLYDSPTDGQTVGSPLALSDVEVVDGLFSVDLDFGAVFDGSTLYLAVEVDEQVLTPRQRIAAAPMAQFALTPAGPEGPQGPEGPEGASPFEVDQDSGALSYDHNDIQFRLGADWTVTAGHAENAASGEGATVAGGGSASEPNVASNSYVTISGGMGNVATTSAATIGGGQQNSASGVRSTVSGGFFNSALGTRAVVGGGGNNRAEGDGSTVSGGSSNRASGVDATIPGGTDNLALGDRSFAAGHGAQAVHHGAFVWADHTDADFASTGDDQFLIRAGGGVGINTNDPQHALDVNGTLHVSEELVSRNIHAETRVGVGMWPFGPVFPVHINPDEDDGDSGDTALAMSRGGDDNPETWTLGVSRNDHLRFRYTDNFLTDDTERMGWISKSSGEYTATSDKRLKRDIEDIDGILEKVLALRPTTYQFKRLSREEEKRQYGFLAQEVQEIFPDLVSIDEDVLGLSYGTFSVIAIQAIQEQQEIITDLEHQLSSLEERLARLEANQ